MIQVKDPIDALVELVLHACKQQNVQVDEEYLKNWAHWTISETQEKHIASFDHVPLDLHFYEDMVDVSKYELLYSESEKVIEGVTYAEEAQRGDS